MEHSWKICIRIVILQNVIDQRLFDKDTVIFVMAHHRKRIALRNGSWTDTYNLERRSAIVGV